jgi:hypothetical protein
MSWDRSVRDDFPRPADNRGVVSAASRLGAERNGIVPNTLYVCFHFATVAVVLALFMQARFLSL